MHMAKLTNPATDVDPSMSTSHAPEQPEEDQKRAKVLEELVTRPLADIAEEVSRLREENATLKAAKTRLESYLRVSLKDPLCILER